MTHFLIAGTVSPLADMLAANAEDAECCEWLRAALVGDVYDTYHGEPVVCVAEWLHTDAALELHADEIADGALDDRDAYNQRYGAPLRKRVMLARLVTPVRTCTDGRTYRTMAPDLAAFDAAFAAVRS